MPVVVRTFFLVPSLRQDFPEEGFIFFNLLFLLWWLHLCLQWKRFVQLHFPPPFFLAAVAPCISYRNARNLFGYCQSWPVITYPQEWMSSSVSLAQSDALHDVLFVTVTWLLAQSFCSVISGCHCWELGRKGANGCPCSNVEWLHGVLCKTGLASGKNMRISHKQPHSKYDSRTT